MEKASTPRNRLTRSSAKQVNTPKNVDQEESLERSPGEEIKNSVRKTRRRFDTKAKTNGDTTSIENMGNNEDVVEDAMGDDCEQENINMNNKSQDSPKTMSQKTPSPTISRRSLRIRRSSTSGPDLESSASKKMKRSSSFGKLDLVSTPTNRRGRRAKSESKDFVFTPSKDKPNVSLRIIEKIDEVNEGEKSSEDEREISNQDSKSLNNLELVDADKVQTVIESVEKEDVVEQSGLKTISGSSVNETDPSTCTKTAVSDIVELNDSGSQKVINDKGILNISQNDSELMKDNPAKENETDEVNTQTDVVENKSDTKPCPSATEIDKSPNTTSFLERNELLDTCSPAKETVKSNELQSEIAVMELVDKSEDKIVQSSVVKDVIVENPDCEIQKSVENTETINEVETNDKSAVQNIEINIDDDDDDDDDDDESVVSFKQLNEQLQSIMDEGMEESDDENRTSCSNSDFPKNIKVQDEAENLETKIELINSSDSEDGGVKERPENSVVVKCKESELCSENENKIKPVLEINDCNKESWEEQTESEPRDNLSGLVPVKDPEISDDHNNQELEKVTNTDPKLESEESNVHTMNNMETSLDQSRVESDAKNKLEEMPALYVMDSEPGKPFNIVIENPHTIEIDNTVSDNATEDAQENNLQDSALQDQSLDKVHNLCEKNELHEKESNEGSCNRPNEQDTNHSDVMIEKDSKAQSVDNYDEENYDEDNLDERYEDEELIKSEDGSCDIYKGLSDSGSYVDEKEEGSQFGESVSSELQSGSGDSEEEFGTSVEEEEENVEEKTRLINAINKEINKELMLSKDGEKLKEKNPDGPITYEKALAIINQNRVKKIDDEEFFDMFTEELNRVSDQSGSDSDIAIVDEYLMEPEEPAKKTQQKSGNIQNAKQPPRLTGPALVKHSTPPENYSGGFNQPVHAQHGQPIPTQHGHPAMQRVSYTQGAMYQQFDQNMHLRGQLMYNQYAHPSSSLQDPHMFNPPVGHPDANFSGMFNPPHPLCPVAEQSFPPSGASLKIRTVTDMNNAQSLSHTIYTNPVQAPLNTSEEKTSDHQDDKGNYLSMSSTAIAEANKTDAARPTNSDTAKSPEFSDKIGDKSRTPILDLLGLDEKALKLLKKVLGLNSMKRELMKLDLEWQKKCLEKSIIKSKMRQSGRKSTTRYRNTKRLRESDSSSSKSSSEQSSEDSSITNFSENDNREVNIEDGSVYVTFKLKSKPRQRNEKEFFNFKKACRSGQKSPEMTKQRNKAKYCRKPRNSSVELCSKKMAQKKPTVVKSQCGNFTVDPLTASSQSSDSEVPSTDDKHQVEELERKMKRQLASGKNKLSNMFSQHPFNKTKESRKKVSESFQEIKGPLRKENLKELRKLPTEILETLSKEDKRKKRHRSQDSGSDDLLEMPKKIRKKSQKIRVKSKAVDQNYIPCVTGGATEFGLSRLDKDGTLTLAEKAAKFRTDQLYGGAVKRITILDFKHQWC